MEEHFILRVPPDVAVRLERVLNEDPSAGNDTSIDLSFQENGRTGSFVIGDDSYPAALLDLPSVVESYKTYDDDVLIKTADVGQIIVVGKPVASPTVSIEYKHGITRAMRDARTRRFRRDGPDDTKLKPEYIHQVESDIQSLLAGETPNNVQDIELVELEGENIEEEDQNTPLQP